MSAHRDFVTYPVARPAAAYAAVALALTLVAGPRSAAAQHATEAPADPSEDAAAERALGTEADDAPDPVADEGLRTGSAEGEPLAGEAPAADELAALTDRACLRALARAQVPFELLREPVGGIATPVRLRGPVGGVTYRSSERRDVHELMDCRLAVTLVRFSRMLRALGVHEVVHYSTYRPAGSAALARQPVQTRHPGGMAIDAAVFHFDDGRRYSVLEHFHGRRGQPVCGPDARVPNDDGARALRTIACDSARRGFFHVLLTPNHNYAHRNHFHLEVTRGVRWQFVH